MRITNRTIEFTYIYLTKRKETMPDQPKQTTGWVPIPNRLFDEVLPELTDSQLRVILIIMRSTLGQREGNGAGGWRFKKRDWITHRQMMKRTGRSSSSISSAIQTLIDMNLMKVEDVHGNLLDTAESRRLTLGKLYFSVVDNWPILWKTPQISRIENVRTTTNNWNNKNSKLHKPAYPHVNNDVSKPGGLTLVSDVLNNRFEGRDNV